MMRLIDEKGRLFGKINFLDLAVCCGIVVTVVVGFQGYHLLKTVQAPVPWVLRDQVEVYCVFDGFPEGLLSKIRLGDTERDPTGRLVIEVLEVFPPKNAIYAAIFGPNMQFHSKSDIVRKQVTTRLRLYGDAQDDPQRRFSCKGIMIQNGTRIDFMTDKYVVRGIIRPGPEREVLVRLKGKNPGYIWNLIKSGDPIYDPDEGFISGEVVEFIPAPPNDVFLWVKLRCWEVGPQLFFGASPIRVGSSLQIVSDSYNLQNCLVLEIFQHGNRSPSKTSKG